MTGNQRTEDSFNYVYGLFNLAGIFCVVWLIWYLFMHPNGVMKLYTPMYGFSLITTLLAAIILLREVLDWPADSQRALRASPAIANGILGAALALAIMYVVYYGMFRLFLGGLGVAYFSPGSLVAGGGTGAEPWNAREWSSTAIVYYGAAFIWWALVYKLGFGSWPWKNQSRWVLGWSRLCVVSLFSIIAYTVLFHPHVCYLFPEAQKMAGVKAWWESWAGTTSAFFGLGVVLCTLFWVVYSDLFWEGQPWKMLEKDGEGNLLKGTITFLATLFLGLIMVFILTQVFNAIWMEPYVGGQNTDGPDWRFVHMAEISSYFILFAFIWKYYFNNFPNGGSLIIRSLTRSLIGIAGGLLIYWFYYSPACKFFTGKVPGWAGQEDKPMVWSLLFFAVVLIHGEFFHCWPLRRIANKKD